MIRYKSLRLRGTAVSAAVILLFSSACLVSEIAAQSAESALTGSSSNPAALSPFLVAPSIPLGYAPSGVATGDLRRSGKLDLVTADYNSGKVTVFLGAGQGKFAPGAEYEAGPHPSAVLVADMNGDGRPDVLVCNESEGTISVLLGKGDGTLQPRQSYTVGFNPSFMATGDFNGSGNVDVAVAGKSGNLLAILSNDGDGNLQKPVLRSLSKTPAALTAADFNSDGHADLALANTDGTVSMLLGKGAGQFRTLPDARVASGPLSSINSGDWSKDGKMGLVVTQLGQKLVSVLLGRGDGTFTSPVSYPVGNEPISTLAADVNGDGVPALVVINKSSNTFSILGGNGDGTFRTSVDFVAGNAPLAAVAGDFYGNGHVDLAIINHSSQTVSVPPGNGDGTFKAARSYSAGVQPVSIASGNLNGGKIPALVVASYCGTDLACGTAGSVAVFLADEKGVYRLSSTYAVGSGPVSVALADLKGDRNLDIVALNRLDKTASVLLGVGDGTFRQPMTFSLAGAPIAVAVGDLNKDGKPDLAVLEDCGSAKCSQAGSLEVLLGAGDGSLQSAASYPVGYSPVSIAVGSIHGGKNLDLVVANRCGKDPSCQSAGTATVLIGNGTGKFTPGTDIALGNSPASIALGNLTGFGLDLVVSRSTDNTVAVLHGNGDGTFRAAAPYLVGNNPGSLVVADFNGDGKADVAVANVNDSTVSILNGRGDGTLQAASELAVGSGPTSLTVVGRINTRHASLATTNGNGGSASPGAEFTVLPNLQQDPPLASFVLGSGTNPSSVNDGVLLTATLTGVGPNPAPTGTITFESGATALSDCTGVSITQGVSPSLISTATCITQMLTAGSDSLTAVYSGDAIYDTGVGETSPAVTQTVSALAPTLGLTSPGASNVNASVTFTAQLAGVAFTPVVPSGNVAFTANGVTITGCGAVAVDATGKATCSTSSLVAPSDAMKATYTGDANFTVAAAATMTQTVNALAATLGLTSPGASNVNASVTFTVQLAGAAFTPVVPSGNVAFTANGVTITGCGAVAVNATGKATCSTSSLAAPSDAIKATYSGDANFTVAAAATMTQTVNALAATLGLTSPGASNVNASVTFTAQLAGAAFTPVFPSGNVAFTANGVTITGCGAVAVDATGKATCSTSSLVAPSDAIKATYSGDANFTVAAAATMTQNENKVTSTVTVSTTTPSVAAGASVTFTAQVGPAGSIAPVPPTGTVTFLINGSASADCPAVTLTAGSAGAAACTTSSLLVPADTITASYTGDTNFTGPVTSPTFTESVGKTPATTTLTSSLPVSSSVNQAVTFTATVKPPSGTVLPTGTVTFTQGATTLCGATGITSATGIATCSYAFSSVTAGTTITATYGGDQNFSAGTPATVSQVVTAASTTTTVVSSPNPSATNQQVAFTATVTPAFTAGTAKPTGTVTFKDTTSATTLCLNLAIAAGTVPVCNHTFTSSGSFDVVATYTSGDTNFTGSASATDVQVVGAGATSVSLTSSPGPSFVDQLVTFNATINFTSSGATVPTGTVVYYDGATALCTFPGSGTSAFTGGIVPACAVPLSAAGTHSITAAFTTSNTNFSSVTSSILSQVVNQTATTTTVVSTPNPSNVNQSVAFTATVTPAFTAGTAIPTGKVTFTNTTSSTTLCANLAIVAGVVPVCNSTFAASGSYNVVAAYTSADSNFANSTSAADVHAVGAGTTSVALTSAPSPSTVNQQVTVTATINFISSGSAVPTGSVVYKDGGTVLCTFPATGSSSFTGGAVPACTVPLYTAGTHPIIAAFTTANTNFSSSTSPLMNQVVTPTATATTVSGPTSSAVNQPATFTATIAPGVTPFAGSTNPTGTVSFSYVLGGVNVPLCTTSIPVSTAGTGASAVTTAACSASLPSQGAYTISAIYTGDSNFFTSTSAAFPIQVGAAATSVILKSSLPVSIATQGVVFTALVSPVGTKGTPPTGTVDFSSSDGTLGTGQLCGVVPLIAAADGTATATCAVQFPAITGGTITVSAAYLGDQNFNGSSTPAPLTQVVENFGLAFTAPTGGTPAALVPVLLTQGYSNASDPFNATKITAAVTTLGGYTDQVNFTCTVTTPSAGTPSTQVPVTDPSCSVSPAFLPSGTSGAVVTYTVSASANAPVGSYTVSLTGSDASVATLSHTTTPSVTVYVVGVSTALTLAPGATGTANALFDTAAAPANANLQTFACGAVVPFVNGVPGTPLTGTGLLTCTGPATAVTGFQTPVLISISPVVKTAQLQRSGTMALAAFLGVPFLALMGWVGGRKSPRRNFFRFLGMFLLIVGLSYATGCGTGFTPPTTTGGSVLPPGSYYVQVVATDQNNVQYFAVVPLTVNQ